MTMQHDKGEDWLDALDLLLDNDALSVTDRNPVGQSIRPMTVDCIAYTEKAKVPATAGLHSKDPASVLSRPIKRRKYPCLAELRQSSAAHGFNIVNRRRWKMTTGAARPIVLTKTEILREEQRKAGLVSGPGTGSHSVYNHPEPPASSSSQATGGSRQRRPLVPLVLPSPSGQQSMLFAPSPLSLPLSGRLSVRGVQALLDPLGSPCDITLFDLGCFSPANGLEDDQKVLSPGTCDRLCHMDFSLPDDGDGVSIATTASNSQSPQQS